MGTPYLEELKEVEGISHCVKQDETRPFRDWEFSVKSFYCSPSIIWSFQTSNLIRSKRNLVAMASNVRAMASNLVAISNFILLRSVSLRLFHHFQRLQGHDLCIAHVMLRVWRNKSSVSVDPIEQGFFNRGVM